MTTTELINSTIETVPDHELKHLLHTKDNSRYILSLCISLSIVISLILSLLVAAYFTKGIALIGLLGLLPLYFVYWFTRKLFHSKLLGSTVRVSQSNFPEIYDVLTEVQKRLNYTKKVEIFLINESSGPSLLYKLFEREYLFINPKIFESMSSDRYRDQLTWIIGQFVGVKKARTLRPKFIAYSILFVEKLKFLNFVTLPYDSIFKFLNMQQIKTGRTDCSSTNQESSRFDYRSTE